MGGQDRPFVHRSNVSPLTGDACIIEVVPLPELPLSYVTLPEANESYRVIVILRTDQRCEESISVRHQR